MGVGAGCFELCTQISLRPRVIYTSGWRLGSPFQPRLCWNECRMGVSYAGRSTFCGLRLLELVLAPWHRGSAKRWVRRRASLGSIVSDPSTLRIRERSNEGVGTMDSYMYFMVWKNFDCGVRIC